MAKNLERTFDQWFIDEAAQFETTPRQYAVSLATIIEDEIRKIGERNRKILTVRDAAKQAE